MIESQHRLLKVKSLKSFKEVPKNYWLLGVRSNADKFNTFDDKFFLFKGEQFIEVYLGTTNAGNDLVNPTNSRGEAVLKTDEIYYNAWGRGKHRGKVGAYVQVLPLLIHRDNDGDRKTEELGTPKPETVGINIHPATYNSGSDEVKSLINGWSQGCQVFAKRGGSNSFNSFMKKTEGQQRLTYCLLKEFDPSTTKLPTREISKQATPVKLLSDDDVSKVLESIVELPNTSFESVESVESVDDNSLEKEINSNTELIIGNKEKPSNITVANSSALQAGGAMSFLIALYKAATNPENLSILIISSIIGILLIGIGVWVYRKSSAEKLELNNKKLDLLSDKDKYNVDLM